MEEEALSIIAVIIGGVLFSALVLFLVGKYYFPKETEEEMLELSAEKKIKGTDALIQQESQRMERDEKEKTERKTKTVEKVEELLTEKKVLGLVIVRVFRENIKYANQTSPSIFIKREKGTLSIMMKKRHLESFPKDVSISCEGIKGAEIAHSKPLLDFKPKELDAIEKWLREKYKESF